MKRYLWMLCLAAFLPGCLSQSHYELLMGQVGVVKALQKNDKKQDRRLDHIEKVLKELQSSLKPEIRNSGVKVEAVTSKSSNGEGLRQVKLTLPQAVLFASGSVRLDRRGRRVLDKVVETLRNNPESRVHIIGYTDSLPVGRKLRARFKDNWELSAARAAAVARNMVWGHKIAKERIVIEGRGAADPVADNSTAAGRARNRRIEIFIRRKA